MLILEIILAVIFLAIVIVAVKYEESLTAVWCTFMSCLMLACILTDIVRPKGVIKKSTVFYSVQTEIKTTTLNGIEISRDTIYIFTPKTIKK